MQVPERSDEQPVAWNAIGVDTPVYASDEQRVGVVEEVMGAEDIFHGIVVRSGAGTPQVIVLAADVQRITSSRIDITLNSEQVRSLPPFQPGQVYKLGFTGLLGRAVGWVRDDKENASD